MTPAEKEAKRNRVKTLHRKLNMRKGKRGFEDNCREIEADVGEIEAELDE